ncbi:hypothetical protein [Blastococcus sp. SYSU D00820]
MTAATGSRPTSPGRVLARTCGAEWARLWSVRTSWWFLAAAAVGWIGIGALAGAEAASEQGAGPGDPAWAAGAFAALPVQFALLALVVTAVTADHATGGIVPTLQWTPRRGVLVLARVAVATGAGTALGVLLALASAVAAHLASGTTLPLPAAEAGRVLGTVALVLAAGAVLAAGLGLLLRSTAGALVTVVLLMLLLPLMLPQFGYSWTAAVAEVLPGSGAAHLLLGEVPGMTRTSSVVVLLAWAGGVSLLGWQRLARSDANR